MCDWSVTNSSLLQVMRRGGLRVAAASWDRQCFFMDAEGEGGGQGQEAERVCSPLCPGFSLGKTRSETQRVVLPFLLCWVPHALLLVVFCFALPWTMAPALSGCLCILVPARHWSGSLLLTYTADIESCHSQECTLAGITLKPKFQMSKLNYSTQTNLLVLRFFSEKIHKSFVPQS